MAVNGFTNIVTDGLVLSLDAGNLKSYPTSGTTWTDLSKNGNNGTLLPSSVNKPTFFSNNGEYLKFDGIDDYVSIPSSTSTAFNGTDYTISVWARISSIHSTQYSAIVSRFGPINNYNGYAIEASNYTGSNKFAFLVGNNNSFNRIFSDSTIVFNTWYNLVGTSTSNVCRFYINGVVQSNTLNFTTATSPSVNLKIGRYYDEVVYATQFLLVGDVSNCLTYNKALSASEVLQNYNATKWRFI